MSYENCIKPIIEVLTLGGVFAALLYQNKTIIEQRKEFKRQKIKDDIQQFENSYFHLLNEYNLLTDKYSGLDRIKHPKQTFLDLLDIEFGSIEIENFKRPLSTIIEMNMFNSRFMLPINTPNQIFPEENSSMFYTLGEPYFKFLKSFFEIIDNVKIYESNNENIEFRKRYFNIIQSKIGVYENYYIFLYTLSSHGSYFKSIVEKYGFFKDVYLDYCFISLKNELNAKAFE